jgi:hypothetical protein
MSLVHIESASALNLDILASRTVRNQCLLFLSCQDYGTLLHQPDQYLCVVYECLCVCICVCVSVCVSVSVSVCVSVSGY